MAFRRDYEWLLIGYEWNLEALNGKFQALNGFYTQCAWDLSPSGLSAQRAQGCPKLQQSITL